LWMGFLVLITLIVYGQALQGGFIWDDDRHVTQNANLRDGEGLKRIWTFIFSGEPAQANTLQARYVPQYYPITHTMFWLQYRVFGLNAFGYHAITLLVHAGSAVLLWRILARLKIPGAWLAAAVFAVHPVNVESVAWISELKNTLSLLLALGSLWFYLRFADAIDETPLEPRATASKTSGQVGVLYVATFGMFVMALLAKTVVVTLPVVILLILWWKRRPLVRHGLALIPFLVVGGVMAWLTRHIETDNVGAAGPDWDLSFAQRTLIAGRAVWFYLGKLLLPIQQSFFYEKWDLSSPHPMLWLFPLSVVAVLGVLGVLALKKPRLRGMFVAFAIFVITLFPALGFVSFYPMRFSYVADHFQYFSTISIITLVVSALALVTARVDKEKISRVIAGSAILLMLLGCTAWVRAGVFVDEIKLWSDTVAKNRTSMMARVNLAGALSDSAPIEASLGNIPEAESRLDRAAALYDEVLGREPDSAEALTGKANILFRRNRHSAALELFERAFARNPRLVAAARGAGGCLLHLKRPAEALQWFNKALEIDPTSIRTHILAADAAVITNDIDAAIRHYRFVIENRPTDLNFNRARVDLARIFIELEAYGDANRLLYNYMQLDSQNPEAWTMMGDTELERPGGTREAALACYRAAVSIDANYEPAAKALDALNRATTQGATQPTTAVAPTANSPDTAPTGE